MRIQKGSASAIYKLQESLRLCRRFCIINSLILYPHETSMTNKMCRKETCSRILAVKHLSDTLHIDSALRKGANLSPLLHKLALEDAIKTVL